MVHPRQVLVGGVAMTVDGTDVSGVQPALGDDRLRRLLRILEVALHDDGAPHQDLIGGAELDFHAR